MYKGCICGDDKIDCVDCMKAYIKQCDEKQKSENDIKIFLLKQLIDDFNEVHSEYHYEIAEKYLNALIKPMPI